MDLILIRGCWSHGQSARVYINDGVTEVAQTRFSEKTEKLLTAYSHRFLLFA